MPLTPREIVARLDRHIIGQAPAKRAVAVAVRNRWRRQRLDPQIGREVTPKNIIMVGPTGVGKTEIARRLASLVDAPFIKVEASKYTEVGYQGRDVDSMIRDLLDLAIPRVRPEPAEAVRAMTGGGVEYSFEALGFKETAEQAFAMIRRSGTATIIGMVPEGVMLEIPADDLLSDKTLKGSNMGSNHFRVDMPRFVEFYLAGKLKLDDMISRRIPIEGINEAFDEMQAGAVARSVIVFE